MTNSSYTIRQLADILGAEVQGDADKQITGVAPIAKANSSQLSFIAQNKFKSFIETSNAAAILVKPGMNRASEDTEKPTLLIVPNPEYAFAKVVELFLPRDITPKAGVHPRAIIGENVSIAEGVSIGPNCIIEDGVVIGENTVIKAGTTIGAGTQIGANCILYANVSIYHDVKIGNNVILHSGVVIGADGFGYARTEEGWYKIPQIGTVVLKDNVEIGANSTVDRGALENTVISQGVKIDNLVQIGHNVEIGDHTIIAGCAGVAGSAKIGKNCMLGGATVVAGHIRLCDNVMISGFSGIGRSLDQPGVYSSGIDSKPHREWMRIYSTLYQLPAINKRLTELEREHNE